MKKRLCHLVRFGLAAACLVSLMPARASAFGGPGHRIVARVAMWRLKQLNAKNALKQINLIYGAKPDDPTDPRNIVVAASWPDSPAVRDNPAYAFADNLHFISIPRRKDVIDSDTPCPKTDEVEEGVCILGGLEHYRKVLLTSKDKHARRDALSFIVHFVGDLHQPLHTSEDLDFDNGNGKGDIGGNLRTVCYLNEEVCTVPDTVKSCDADIDACSIPAANGKRKRRELHKVWDNFMFDTEMDKEHLNLTEEGYAARLIKQRAEKLTAHEIAAIAEGGPADWAVESHALAKRVVYDLPDPVRKKNPDGKVRAHYFVSRQYRDANIGRAEEQLIRSGIRLAHYLSQIFPEK